jgi:predicted small lipoprotein YifL
MMKTLHKHLVVLAIAFSVTGCRTTVPPQIPPAIKVTVEIYDVELASMPSALHTTTLTVELLAQLVEQNHAVRKKVVSILTNPKVQSSLKIVTEYIYPTEYESNGISSGGNNNNKSSDSVGAVTTPSAFETREVGTIFEVLTGFLSDGRIAVTISPAFVAPPIWKSYGHVKDLRDGQASETVIEQPFFHTFEFRSTVRLRSGQPAIAAYCPSLTSDDKVQLMVIKATTF